MGFYVNPQQFYWWANRSIRKVQNIKSTFEKISAIWEVHSRKWIPLDQGYLENSMEERIFTNYPFMEMQLRWSGEENPNADGFDYAYYQDHWLLHHPKRPQGWNQSQFVEKGMNNALDDIIMVLETDYLTALGV